MSRAVYLDALSRIPGRTVRADIRLDIRKITDVRVALSVQICTVNPWDEFYCVGISTMIL